MGLIREIQQLARFWRSEYYFWVHQTDIDAAMSSSQHLIQQSRFKLAVLMHNDSALNHQSKILLEKIDLCEKALGQWSVMRYSDESDGRATFQKIIHQLRRATDGVNEIVMMDEELLTHKIAADSSRDLIDQAKQLAKFESSIVDESLIPRRMQLINKFIDESKSVPSELKSYLSQRMKSIDWTAPMMIEKDYHYIKNLVVSLAFPQVNQFMKDKRITNTAIANEMIEAEHVSRSIESIRNNIPDTVLKQAMLSFHKVGGKLEIEMKLPEKFMPALFEDMKKCVHDVAGLDGEARLQAIAVGLARKKIPQDFSAILKDCKKFNDAYDALKYPNSNMKRVSHGAQDENAKRKNLLLLTKPLIAQLENKIHQLSLSADNKSHDRRDKLEQLLFEVCIAMQNPNPEQGLSSLKELVKSAVYTYKIDKHPLQFFSSVSRTFDALRACERAINQSEPLITSLTQNTAKKFRSRD